MWFPYKYVHKIGFKKKPDRLDIENGFWDFHAQIEQEKET